MSAEPIIIVFKDSVSKDEVKKYADDIVENGGTVKDRYYESGLLNGFSATVSESYLSAFKSVKGGEIKYIEGDQTVTTQ